MQIREKSSVQKNMSEDEIRATANRNVYSNTDTASTLKKEKYELTEISKLDENSLKAYNDKQPKNAYNEFNNTQKEYKSWENA